MAKHDVFKVQHKTGTTRSIQFANGTVTQDHCIANIGELQGQGRNIPAILCDGAVEQDHWNIFNLVDENGLFLNHVAVRGAVSEEQQNELIERYFQPILTDSVIHSSHVLTNGGLERFLNEKTTPGNTKFLLLDDANHFNHRVTKITPSWDEEQITSHNGRVGEFLLDMVRHDDHDELLEHVTPQDLIVDLLDGTEGMLTDAMMLEYKQFDRVIKRLGDALRKQGDHEFNVENVTPIAPFKKNGVVNVGVIFEMNDTQTVTVLFNNPDSTPAKLTPSDILTSWKWMLNKRDVTAALQPKAKESTRYTLIAKRMMQLLVKNHGRFQRAAGERLRIDRELQESQALVDEKKQALLNIEQQIADQQAKIDEFMAEKQHNNNADVTPDHKMQTLMERLKNLGFTAENGLNGLSKENIAVSIDWTGKKSVVAIDNKQVFVSESEDEIIDFVNSELSKNTVSRINDQYDIEVMAAEVAKDAEMKYYADEDNRGKAELIKNAMAYIKFDLPQGIKFSDFQKLVELNLNDIKPAVDPVPEQQSENTQEQADQNAASNNVTEYALKSTNPKARKPVGKIKLTLVQDGIYEVFGQEDSVGGETVGDIESIKRWIAGRYIPMGTAIYGDGGWDYVKNRLKLMSGDDVLGIENATEPTESENKAGSQADIQVPEGFAFTEMSKGYWAVNHQDLPQSVSVKIFEQDQGGYQASFQSASSTVVDDLQVSANWAVNTLNDFLSSIAAKSQEEQDLINNWENQIPPELDQEKFKKGMDFIQKHIEKNGIDWNTADAFKFVANTSLKFLGADQSIAEFAAVSNSLINTANSMSRQLFAIHTNGKVVLGSKGKKASQEALEQYALEHFTAEQQQAFTEQQKQAEIERVKAKQQETLNDIKLEIVSIWNALKDDKYLILDWMKKGFRPQPTKVGAIMRFKFVNGDSYYPFQNNKTYRSLERMIKASNQIYGSFENALIELGAWKPETAVPEQQPEEVIPGTAAQPETAATPEQSPDEAYLNQVIQGAIDLSGQDVGERLEQIGENLPPELEPLFEQAADAYAAFAIENAKRAG
ncbi:defense against restriction DarA-related protein [Acinetobacter defluvii]|uniref:defense against restriction DarA-related protein n=1 Tax=Acinetobacter defluvii TaxID=1871111 RepID=UPI0008248268|nr:hypothetical protein [Acinetobacter defluvii]